MIYYKTKNVNTLKIEAIVEEYENTVNFTGIECPKCGSKEFIYWSSYERNVIYEEADEIRETTINIKRIKCECCKKTHAIIPDFLVPYKQHPLKLINEVLEERMVHKKTGLGIEREKHVSRQLQLVWKKQFKMIRGKIETMLVVFELKKVFENIKEDVNFTVEYYKKQKEIYMLKRKKIFYNYVTT